LEASLLLLLVLVVAVVGGIRGDSGGDGGNILGFTSAENGKANPWSSYVAVKGGVGAS